MCMWVCVCVYRVNGPTAAARGWMQLPSLSLSLSLCSLSLSLSIRLSLWLSDWLSRRVTSGRGGGPESRQTADSSGRHQTIFTPFLRVSSYFKSLVTYKVYRSAFLSYISPLRLASIERASSSEVVERGQYLRFGSLTPPPLNVSELCELEYSTTKQYWYTVYTSIHNQCWISSFNSKKDILNN